jgi:bifunctional DNase/RNase
MDKVELRFLRIAYSHTHAGAYALVLGEAKGERRLPIIIGGNEAQSIALVIEQIKPARPLTHDLFKAFCDPLEIKVDEVIISDLVDGIFHATIVVSGNGKSAEIDARSSDAIALALRFQCPIYTYERILSEAGLTVDESEENVEEESMAGIASGENEDKPVSARSEEELNELLEDALNREDYEMATLIRDEISRRKGSN